MLSSYAGNFDPTCELDDFSRQMLAHLGREYLLLGHMIDRVGLPLIMSRYGGEANVQFSIDEWMGASPIYSKRMQRALGFEGSDVSTVFKNLQLDIGAPPQFMDFQFRLDRPDYGEFWLPHCGALLDVEPFGEEKVRLMCHDIEDPTFDATAAATHPCMKMRAIHRPPRIPAGRYPHCHWMVFIDEESTPYEQHPNLELNLESKIAKIEIQVPDENREPGGWADYSGPFDPGFQLEDLCHRSLLIVAQETSVQTHLLVRAFLRCVAERYGETDAMEIGRGQWTGNAALGALRIKKLLGIEDNGIAAIAKIFQLHPHFHPRSYVDFRVAVTGPDSAQISIGPCPALEEDDAYSWFAGLDAASHPALDAIAGIINPKARALATDPNEGAALAWNIIIDPANADYETPSELKLARISRGAEFEFMQRRSLRN